MLKLLALLFLSTISIAQIPVGAWKSKEPSGSTATMIITDGYLTIAAYDVRKKLFERTEGGAISMAGDQLRYIPEFNSADSSKIGVVVNFTVTRKNDILTLRHKDTWVWVLIDDAQSVPMAGEWHITERAENGVNSLVKIHQSGTRKTIKMLSGTRFQWIAIDPAVKGFYGTGGGTYVIKNGKYTERIEYFSRDNNRVGNHLTFNWQLNNGRWDHSGKSSKGDPIHEVWEK